MKLFKKSLLTLAMLACSGLALAQDAAAPTAKQGFMSMLPMLIIFAVVFYFLLIRPQSKRAKEQKQMMDSLHLDDEILTSGGVIGRVTRLRDNYVYVMISKNTEVMLQKNAIAAVLPKGTLEIS